ncbi:MAG TPA: hypothetical protein VMU87_05195 [Stellaceae bacterium]|nr:hypothetical protein [Stellaceae bacterium]
MRLRQRCLYQFGFRLAFIALAIQASIPFLLAVEIQAYTAAAESVVIAQNLCAHNGTSRPSDRSPGHDCNLAGCPLCTTLAALTSFGPPGESGMSVPVVAASRAPATGDDWRSTPPFSTHPYRSRAPPLA